MQEPAVVCDVHEQICAIEHKASRQISDCVFETDQGRHKHIVLGEPEDSVIFPEIEIPGDPFPGHGRE